MEKVKDEIRDIVLRCAETITSYRAISKAVEKDFNITLSHTTVANILKENSKTSICADYLNHIEKKRHRVKVNTEHYEERRFELDNKQIKLRPLRIGNATLTINWFDNRVIDIENKILYVVMTNSENDKINTMKNLLIEINKNHNKGLVNSFIGCDTEYNSLNGMFNMTNYESWHCEKSYADKSFGSTSMKLYAKLLKIKEEMGLTYKELRQIPEMILKEWLSLLGETYRLKVVVIGKPQLNYEVSEKIEIEMPTTTP